MQVEWREQARRQLQGLEQETVQAIVEKVQTVSEHLPHPDVKVVEDPEIGSAFWLRVRPDGRQTGRAGIDHRVLFDIEDGLLAVYDVRHRDDV